MPDDKNYDEEFGVDLPFGEARARFAKETREEIEENGGGETALVADGTVELALFKGKEIRRICHNGEWMFSIVDVIAALTDSDRPSGYWTDLRTKMAKNEGFDEL